MKLRVDYSVSGGIKMTIFSSIMCPEFCLSDISNFAQVWYIDEAKKYLVLEFMQNSARTAKTRLRSKMYVPLLAVFLDLGQFTFQNSKLWFQELIGFAMKRGWIDFRNKFPLSLPQSGISLSQYVHICKNIFSGTILPNLVTSTLF